MEKTLEQRKTDSAGIRKKHPGHIPVILLNNKNDPKINIRTKYLLPRNLKLGEFMLMIRTKLDIKQEEALFFYVDNILPQISSTIEDIDKIHRNDDGFLYFTFAMENIYG
jgi:GABA(A) receptor-associated protein